MTRRPSALGAVVTGSAAAILVFVVYLAVIPAPLASAVVVSAACGVFVGVTSYRRLSGRPAVSDRFAVGLTATALAVYALVLALGAVPRDAGEWIAMVVVFVIALGPALEVWGRRRRERRSRSAS